MTLLVDRWPRLSALPHVSLGTFPTPVERLTKLSSFAGADVWVKRDDRSGATYGGNKVRKLEFLLGAAIAEGADTILTTGAVGSHHVLATTLYGRQKGFDVHAVLMPQERTLHVEKNVRADIAAGAHIHPISSYGLLPTAMAALAARLKLQRRKIFGIGPGGSDAVGVLGWIEGGLELAHQMTCGETPSFDAIYLPLGSGGTAAGLALGLAAAGVPTKVIAVRVTPRQILRKAMIAALSRGVVQRIREHDDRFPGIADIAMKNLIIEEGFLGGGYGIATGAGREAMRIATETDGLVLDASYTAKTMAALLDHARHARRGERLMFLHTLSSVSIEPLLRTEVTLPPRVAALLR